MDQAKWQEQKDDLCWIWLKVQITQSLQL
jgi:hypothetical protein